MATHHTKNPHSPGSAQAVAWQEDYDQGYAEAKARCRTILTAPEADDRHRAALHLAVETDLPAADAAALLRTVPADQSVALGELRTRPAQIAIIEEAAHAAKH